VELFRSNFGESNSVVFLMQGMVPDAAVDPNILSYPVPIIMMEQGVVVRQSGAISQTSGEVRSILGRRMRWSLAFIHWARPSPALGGRAKQSLSLGGQATRSPSHRGQARWSLALKGRARRGLALSRRGSALGRGRAVPQSPREAELADGHRARQN